MNFPHNALIVIVFINCLLFTNCLDTSLFDYDKCMTYTYVKSIESSSATNVCFSSKNKNFYSLTNCKKGEFCEYDYLLKQEGNSSCKETYELLPGSKCNKDTQCLSQKCINNKCVGFEEGLNCTKHKDCDVGLACFSSQKCRKQIQLTNNEPCTMSEECENNLGCSIKGKCIQYFSLDLGEDTSNSLFCRSGFSYGGKCMNKILVNDDGFPINNFKCEANQSTCRYRLSNGEYLREKCVCSVTDKSQTFCPPDTRDYFVKKKLSYQSRDFKNRHTSERFKLYGLTLNEIKDYYYPYYNQSTPDDLVNILEKLQESRALLITVNFFLAIILFF